MNTGTVALADLAPLVTALHADGYRVIGPTVREDAIVLAELRSVDELPYGRGVATAAGRYRSRRRADRAASYLHGGPVRRSVRRSVRSRYRQWLTHTVGTWHDQFGEPGCVGCGRCIAWCPVGIDITEDFVP